MFERSARPMFIKLSYSCDDRKLFCELASTCQLAASGFCKEGKSALTLSCTLETSSHKLLSFYSQHDCFPTLNKTVIMAFDKGGIKRQIESGLPYQHESKPTNIYIYIYIGWLTFMLIW